MSTTPTLEERSLESLEWSLVREALAARTRSPLGQTVASHHSPFPTPSGARRLRERVLEGQVLIEQSPVHGLAGGVRDVSDLLDRAARDGVLDPSQLFACGHFFQSVGFLGSELRARAAQAPRWADDFAKAPPTPPVCERIFRSVTSEGAILDSASPDLARLRRQRVEKRAEFEATLSARVKEWSARGLLQDNFYDQVDGRYVVPVKAGEQSKLEGTLVSRSNTGQSVFIEPAELTISNNALKELDLEVRAEEFRILRSLSSAVGALTATFLPWLEVVAELDLALAAAVLSKDWELHEPLVQSQAASSALDLLEVFHPGLKLRAVEIVRNSLALESGGRALLISGPNTGGKTVLLKAAALSACMARAGLLVPARKHSVVPHYAAVFAFIGDEQNLAQGLSSFSAQIMDLKAVLAEERAPVLIVIDEILSSTDPEEASALAQSVIEELIARGHHVIVTSHFSELSLRSKINPLVTVAAMEFEAGRPTYRLRTGELGSSHALEVAERLGFPRQLLARARSLMKTAKLDYERALGELKTKEAELLLERDRAVNAAEREKERYKDELKGQLEKFMAESQSRIAEAVSQLTDRLAVYTRPGTGGAATPSAGKTIARLESAARDVAQAITQAASGVRERLGAPAAAPAPLPLTVGAHVRILSMKGSRGVVLELKGTGSSQTAVLQIGNFRLEKRVGELEALPAPQSQGSRFNTYVGLDTGESVARKLDVRGKRYDDALAECERYIDLAFRSGAAQVTVVTGHGTGALKKGLKELLSGLPYVREFRPEREGDDGATLIEFDR